MTIVTMLVLVAAPVPRLDEGLIWVHEQRPERLLAYRSDGTAVRTLDLPRGEVFLGLTADGGQIVYAALAGGRMTYQVRALGKRTPGTDLGLDHTPSDQSPIWTRDGKRFLRVRYDRASGFKYAVFEPATKKLTPLDLPDNRWVIGWTADEKGVVTWAGSGTAGRIRFDRLGEKGTTSELPHPPLRPNRVLWTADGRTLLVPGYINVPMKRFFRHSLWTIDARTGKAVELIHEPGQRQTDAHWSPDGKRLWLLWAFAKDEDRNPGWDEHRLTVMKPDGSDRVTVTLRDRAKGEDPYGLRLLGWFPAPR